MPTTARLDPMTYPLMSKRHHANNAVRRATAAERVAEILRPRARCWPGAMPGSSRMAPEADLIRLVLI